MPSFTISTHLTGGSFSLSGEAGLITASGSVTSQTSPAVFVLSGNSSLTVMGTIIGNNPAIGDGTVGLFGARNDVFVGSTGFLRNMAGDAISVGVTSTLAQIANFGTIIGFSEAVDINATTGAARLNNAGTITSISTGAIETATTLSLNNSGTISSFTADATIRTGGALFQLFNTGLIANEAESAAIGGLAARYMIQNAGEIRGAVLMGTGNDLYDGRLGTVTGFVNGQLGNDRLLAGAGDNSLGGDVGNDTLDGGQGDDNLAGGDGADVIWGGQGSDSVNGGAGFDLLDYRRSAAGIELDLRSGDGFGGDAEGDRVLNIESVRGTAFADVILGDQTNNVLRGGAGADRLAGNDGNDTLRGDGGADTLAGGAGIDMVTYSGIRDSVSINLVAQTATGSPVVVDSLSSIENAEGGEVADVLIGSNQANLLIGGGGGDYLDGGAGNDTLTGGLLGDADAFVFTRTGGTDLITDFELGRDLLNLIDFGITDISLVPIDLSVDEQDFILDFNSLGFAAVITLKGAYQGDIFALWDDILLSQPI